MREDFGTRAGQDPKNGSSSPEPAFLCPWLEEEEKAFLFALGSTIPSPHLSSLAFPGSKRMCSSQLRAHDGLRGTLRRETLVGTSHSASWSRPHFQGLPCSKCTSISLFSCEVVSDSFVTPVDCSLPGSSARGISQARILEWVAISSSRGSSRPRDRTQVSCLLH